LELWSKAPEGSRLVSGATDILPWAREGRAGDVHIPSFVDVTRVAEFEGHSVAHGRIRLGANVVYQDFLTDGVLKRLLPCMPYCAIWFADDQIREQAHLPEIWQTHPRLPMERLLLRLSTVWLNSRVWKMVKSKRETLLSQISF
jgi:xanthine dehydrogenase iron-sulfur cluster and FAD-binding subunit A